MMKVRKQPITQGGAVRRTRAASIARLGDTLSEVMEDRITPQQRNFDSIAGLWAQLLPTELSRHCRIVDISAGRLKVLVDSPSYMCELRLCSSAVLKELQQQRPQARLQEIKVVVG